MLEGHALQIRDTGQEDMGSFSSKLIVGDTITKDRLSREKLINLYNVRFM